jgi:toxin-antitoxin system PIN domain toxin
LIALPDVNVLVALAWPNHVHHQAARAWFRSQWNDGWATCPSTENAFIRISSNAKIVPEARRPAEAAFLLRELIALKGHVLWPEESSVLDDRRVSLDLIRTYRQVTDAHLLAVALRHEGRLASFDRGLLDLVPPGLDPESAVQLIPARL